MFGTYAFHMAPKGAFSIPWTPKVFGTYVLGKAPTGGHLNRGASNRLAQS